MSSRQPDAVAHAVAVRDQGRSRVRAATAVAGVTGLAMTGLVSLILPGPAHKSAASGTGSPASAGTPGNPAPADPGSGTSGGSASSGSASDGLGSGGFGSGGFGSGGFGAPSSGSGASHATSGGS